MNFKSIVLAGTLAASAFIATPAVKAEVACGLLNGAGRWCGEWVGEYQNGTAFEITYSGNAGREQMLVVCNGSRVSSWSSNGTLTQAQAEWVAQEFCALPG